ncbi:MAG TPA: triphosphoribosyl-dephospho-CoA synthase [Steroidobacteraceae bacterium]|jgi:triphosphoribosyl-dephospho-CoA synthase|nr:triphosphoribosyl-dephospho-CoA synthase [Steroidobacteraceae bacterium]
MAVSRQALAGQLRDDARRRAAALGARAERALILEALLTPKPALVDRRGPGAHHDLDLARLLRSAHALRGSFERMALAADGGAVGVPLRERLGALGRRAELLMLTASGGSNTHRGAIYVLGLLVASLALSSADASPKELAATAARLARLPDRYAPLLDSNGARACRTFGVGGARAEAAEGFPHVIRVGLPALKAARARGVGESGARLDALMAIMASLDDTCLLHRGGWPAVEAARRGARAVLAAGGSSSTPGRAQLLALDAELKRRNASPGGCADLLAACLLIDGGKDSSCEDNSWNA